MSRKPYYADLFRYPLIKPLVNGSQAREFVTMNGCPQTPLRHPEEIRDNSTPQQYSCEICGKTFSVHSNLQRHIRCIHRSNRHYPCPECGKVLASKSNLQKHDDFYHKGKRVNQCPICAKQFVRPRELRRHVLNLHLDTKKYHCDLCKKPFSDKFSARRHLRDVHKRSPKPSYDRTGSIFPARTAGTFTNPRPIRNKNSQALNFDNLPPLPGANLAICMTTDGSEQSLHKFPCFKCGKGFSCKYYLRKHENFYHKGITDYQCSVCGKPFVRLYELRRHAKSVHVVTSTQTSLAHEQVYLQVNGNRKELGEHYCAICKKVFSAESTVRRHIRHVHLRIKGHQCLVCEKKFFHLRELRTHVRKEHEVTHIEGPAGGLSTGVGHRNPTLFAPDLPLGALVAPCLDIKPKT
ncbi:hypothetical protein AAHC03_05030 [Spirometra sp. Aus1]